MTTFTQPEPLTDAELDRLGDFLKGCKGGKAMNVERLDGFFAALIAGPETVMPSEYNREVFGGDLSEVVEFARCTGRIEFHAPQEPKIAAAIGPTASRVSASRDVPGSRNTLSSSSQPLPTRGRHPHELHPSRWAAAGCADARRQAGICGAYEG